MKIAIIGAGAAGMMAAACAASRGAEVTLYESGSQPGKKILATGNGRCNFTNDHMTPDCFRSSHPFPVTEIIGCLDQNRVMDYFRQIGVPAVHKNGYVYPHSEQATSLRDALMEELLRAGVNLVCDTTVTAILSSPENQCFQIMNKDQILDQAHRVILTTGGKAAPKTGSDGKGLAMAIRLGHSLIPPVPALVQLRSDDARCSKLHGVRVQGLVQLEADGQVLSQDQGEIQMTDYGISGIPVFQVSRYGSEALLKGQKVTAVLDFLPEDDSWKLLLQDMRSSRGDKSLVSFLRGYFPQKLSSVLAETIRVPEEQIIGELTARQIEALDQAIHHFTLSITGSNGFDQAQVSAGGIPLHEVDPHTLESLKVPGLYFAGEILDVDGICGGYNLQWAWSSGHVAGHSAAQSGSAYRSPDFLPDSQAVKQQLSALSAWEMWEREEMKSRNSLQTAPSQNLRPSHKKKHTGRR